MQDADFTVDAPGRLVPIPEGGSAFVPAPLPPRLMLDTATANLLAEARGAVGELAGVGRQLPDPHLLISPFLRREAITSSRIEGTYATAEELVLFEAEDSKPPPKPDVREVANYVRAMEHGLRRLDSLPICSRFIRELHRILMEGVRGQEERPGEFRTVQNVIGRRGDPIEKARFVPPPPAEMLSGMDELERYIAEGNDLHILVRTALVHYQFEAIHPFRDGNGRLGRLLASLLFCERKLLPEPLLYLSSFFDRNVDEYRDRLLAVSQQGDWSGWVSLFLRAVQEQSLDAIARACRLLTLWERWRRETQSARSSALLPKLVDALFATPALTIPKAGRIMGVTYAAAQRNVRKLVDAGILRPASDATYNKVYVADEIIKIVAMETA
jgi:Fic family protein